MFLLHIVTVTLLFYLKQWGATLYEIANMNPTTPGTKLKRYLHINTLIIVTQQ